MGKETRERAAEALRQSAACTSARDAFERAYAGDFEDPGLIALIDRMDELKKDMPGKKLAALRQSFADNIFLQIEAMQQAAFLCLSRVRWLMRYRTVIYPDELIILCARDIEQRLTDSEKLTVKSFELLATAQINNKKDQDDRVQAIGKRNMGNALDYERTHGTLIYLANHVMSEKDEDDWHDEAPALPENVDSTKHGFGCLSLALQIEYTKILQSVAKQLEVITGFIYVVDQPDFPEAFRNAVAREKENLTEHAKTDLGKMQNLEYLLGSAFYLNNAAAHLAPP